MTENNIGQQQFVRLPNPGNRRNFNPNLNAGQLITPVTRQEVRNVLRAQTAEILGALAEPLEALGIQSLQQGGQGDQRLIREVRQNLGTVAQQFRATTSIFDLPLNQIPTAIRERMIRNFRNTMIAGARAPFTLAAYAGYHGIIMPIPIVIRHAGGLFYTFYCYFFVFIVIFGTRYYYVEYAENERAQQLLNFIYNTFFYVIYPTKVLMNIMLEVINVAIIQSKKNFQRFLPALANGVKGGADMAARAACDNAPMWGRWAMRCR